MAKKKKNKGYTPKAVNPMKYARQMMRAYLKPQMRAFNRAGQQAEADYGQYANQLDAIWGAVSKALPQIASGYNEASQGVMSNYGDTLGSLARLVGGIPGGEQAAAMGYLGNMGASGQGLLASGAARNAGYGASASRQSVIDQATAKTNALTELQQLLDSIAQQKLDLRADVKSMLPQWAMQGQEYNLAYLEYLLREKALEGQLGAWDAANQYYSDAFTGQGNNAGGGAAKLAKGWLSGAQNWNQLSPQEKEKVRQVLTADPTMVRDYFPSIHPNSMTVQQLIQAINALLKPKSAPGPAANYPPGSQGGPQ